jgi:hypothetical protein
MFIKNITETAVVTDKLKPLKKFFYGFLNY